ncbi:hypothetical protein DFH11DRAFT_1687323 [Phellopilus nigrolimitatus]|nr:hypothetical protein DFH11DRAFT_1687323 [Phellopilus nigrolimitatus]
MSVDISLSDEHPFVRELSSLHHAVSHYQAHRAAVQLNRHSLETATALQRLHALENENGYLRTELDVLRSHPNIGSTGSGSHRDTLQVQELTLALRRLSDKLDLTENVLLARTEELVFTKKERDKANLVEETAYAVAVRLRTELEDSRAKEKVLLGRVKSAEEERKMSDLVVKEYANLVRKLEGRSSTSSRGQTNEDGHASLDGLTSARHGLQKLLQDSNIDSEKLHAEIGRLHGALEMLQANLDVERKAAMDGRRQLAQAQLELHRLQTDDNAAAKMVSRYMKFSQSSTDVLHGAIENMKARHASTITTFESRLRQTEDRLALEVRQSERLRQALDELTEDISRETYGRRREVALRLALLGREECLSERLKRWLLGAQEAFQKARSSGEDGMIGSTFPRFLASAEDILNAVDSLVVLDGDSVGSAARVLSAQTAVSALKRELQKETDRRLFLECQLAGLRSETTEAKSFTPAVTVTGLRQKQELPATSAVQDITDTFCASTKPVDVPADADSNFSVARRIQSPPPSLLVTSPALDDEPRIIPALENGIQTKLLWSRIMDNLEVPLRPKLRLRITFLPTAPSTLKTGSSASEPVGDLAKETPEALLKTLEITPSEEPPSDHLRTPPAEEQDASNDAADVQKDPIVCQTADSEGQSVQSEPDLISRPVDMPQSARYKDQIPFPPSTADDAPTEIDLSEDLLEEPPSGLNPTMNSLLSRLSEIAEQSSRLEDLSGSSSTFQTAVERLDDYCEDARVELEIRIADEERITNGYQTLLSVRGALSDEVNESAMIRQIEAFIDGSDPTVRRAQDMLKHKLDDLQHDIAAVKRTIHETPSPSPLLHPQEIRSAEEPQKAFTSSWTSWTGSILSSSRSSSPAPAPSFGTVMTSPRLRHSSSIQRIRADSNNSQNSFAGLGLRIPMPSQAQVQSAPPPSSLAATRGGPRPRVASTMFSLGLGGGGETASKAPTVPNAPASESGGFDSDVE